MDLLRYARDMVGDANWSLTPADIQLITGLDWTGADRDAADALLRQSYWEPRVPPAERVFYPGGASLVGFLAWGESLPATLATDGRLVEARGWDRHALGQRLKELLDRAAVERDRLLADLPTEGSYEQQAAQLQSLQEQGVAVGGLCIRLRSFRGFQSCPFAGCVYARQRCPHSSLDFHLVDPAEALELRGPGLAWHLIAGHGFFGGPASPYRVDPETVARLLDSE